MAFRIHKRKSMKKLFLTSLIFLFDSALLNAQYTRFIYQVSMKLDSTNRNEIKTERARLDISENQSFFYGENRIKRDSLIERMRATRNFDRNAMQNLRSALDYIVEKSFSKNTTVFKGRIGRDIYEYEEDRAMIWKILPETIKIGTYETQKAETTFAGRKWFAWFTQEIPFHDGPYKFKGLPGLIVKVEDTKGDYSFDLMQTTKTNQLPNFENRAPVIKVKRKEFFKQEELFKNDLLSFFANSSAGGFSIRMQEADPAERKRREERIKEEVRKVNNPIELKN